MHRSTTNVLQTTTNWEQEYSPVHSEKETGLITTTVQDPEKTYLQTEPNIGPPSPPPPSRLDLVQTQQQHSESNSTSSLNWLTRLSAVHKEKRKILTPRRRTTRTPLKDLQSQLSKGMMEWVTKTRPMGDDKNLFTVFNEPSTGLRRVVTQQQKKE